MDREEQIAAVTDLIMHSVIDFTPVCSRYWASVIAEKLVDGGVRYSEDYIDYTRKG